MPKKKKGSSKGSGRQTKNEEVLKGNVEKIFSLLEDSGAGLAAKLSHQGGLGLDEIEEIANSETFGLEERDILMEERELRRKAEMDLQKKLQLVKDGKYKSPAPHHDGDQTPLKGHPLRILKTQWSGGMDYNPENPHLSGWMKSLYCGDYSSVLKKINQTSQENLLNLLENRESLLNVSAIFHVVIGARTLCGDSTDLRGQIFSQKKNQVMDSRVFKLNGVIRGICNWNYIKLRNWERDQNKSSLTQLGRLHKANDLTLQYHGHLWIQYKNRLLECFPMYSCPSLTENI